MPSTYEGTGRAHATVPLLEDGDALTGENLSAADKKIADALASVNCLALNFDTERVKATSADVNAIVYGKHNGAELWVAVGDSEVGSGALIVISTAGQYWTERANPKDATLYGVAFDPVLGTFAACGATEGVGVNADAYLLTSSDGGATWTERGNPVATDLYAITSNGTGVFVAVGQASGGQAYVLRSADGVTWAQQSCPVNVRLLSVTFGKGLFVAVGGSGSTGKVVTSPDGITWTERANPSTDSIDSVAWNGSVFLTAASAGEVLYSADGITWGTRSTAGIPAGGGSYIISADTVTGITVVGATTLFEFFASIDDGVTFKNMGPADRLDAPGPLEIFAFASGGGRWMGAARYGHVLRGRFRR